MTAATERTPPTREVYGEAWTWAMEWAAKLHADAPPEADDEVAHIRHQYERLYTDEVLSTFPAHLREYDLRPGIIVRNAITEYRFRLREVP